MQKLKQECLSDKRDQGWGQGEKPFPLLLLFTLKPKTTLENTWLSTFYPDITIESLILGITVD